MNPLEFIRQLGSGTRLIAACLPPSPPQIVPYNSKKVFLFYSEIAFQGDAVGTALSIRAVEGLEIRSTYFPRFLATNARAARVFRPFKRIIRPFFGKSQSLRSAAPLSFSPILAAMPENPIARSRLSNSTR